MHISLSPTIIAHLLRLFFPAELLKITTAAPTHIQTSSRPDPSQLNFLTLACSLSTQPKPVVICASCCAGGNARRRDFFSISLWRSFFCFFINFFHILHARNKWQIPHNFKLLQQQCTSIQSVGSKIPKEKSKNDDDLQIFQVHKTKWPTSRFSETPPDARNRKTRTLPTVARLRMREIALGSGTKYLRLWCVLVWFASHSMWKVKWEGDQRVSDDQDIKICERWQRYCCVSSRSKKTESGRFFYFTRVF